MKRFGIPSYRPSSLRPGRDFIWAYLGLILFELMSAGIIIIDRFSTGFLKKGTYIKGGAK